MTIIYDMANGSIQSETTPESGGADTNVITAPVADLRLAEVESLDTTDVREKPHTGAHLIRAMLLSK